MSETAILKVIHIALAAAGSRIFRNNVGSLQDRHGQYVTYGLCPGSSDLIGWTPLKITSNMVGKTVAVFTAVEVKDPSKRSKATEEQDYFLKVVEATGGIAFLSHSPDEALSQLRSAIDGFQWKT